MDITKKYRWKVVEHIGTKNECEFEGTIFDLLEKIIKLVILYANEDCMCIGRNFNVTEMFNELFAAGEYVVDNCQEGIYIYLLGEA